MRAVIQRVTHAAVSVDDAVVGAVGPGLVVLLGVARGDAAGPARALAAKIHALRILRGETSLADRPGHGVLAVSQFTLLADTRKGRRPSWSAASPGHEAEPVFDAFVASLRGWGTMVATGVFGADMALELTNDGPVTIVLDG